MRKHQQAYARLEPANHIEISTPGACIKTMPLYRDACSGDEILVSEVLHAGSLVSGLDTTPRRPASCRNHCAYAYSRMSTIPVREHASSCSDHVGGRFWLSSPSVASAEELDLRSKA